MTVLPELRRIKLSRSGRIGVVRLASDKVNALDVETLTEITTAVDYYEGEPDVDALVMTGEGRLFSAGLNVTKVLANDLQYTEMLLDVLEEALVRIFTCPMPTVAAVNGPAIAGGCILACAFDKRLISEDARIGVTELRVGVSFPVVAVELLRHVCGSDTERLIFDAELLDADRRLSLRSGPRTASGVRARAGGNSGGGTTGCTRCPRLLAGQDLAAPNGPVVPGG